MGATMVCSDQSLVVDVIQLIERLRVTPEERKEIIDKLEPAFHQYFYKKSTAKLNSYTLKPLPELSHSLMSLEVHQDDSRWLLADDTGTWCNWSGFMAREANKNQTINRISKIKFLPVIDGSPTDWSTINTTLRMFVEESGGAPVIVVTFDWQLFIKALEIVMSKNYKIILRVGGFNKVKSYPGSIGMIMAGSGLEGAMKLVFDGEGTFDKIMKGGDYSKCVRAHRLISKTLVLSAKHLFEDEIDTSVLERIKSMGRTPALWVQYLEMTLTVNQFILAEKTGDYKLLFQSTRAMAPIFASTGYHNYVKASRLMIQMNGLPSTSPWSTSFSVPVIIQSDILTGNGPALGPTCLSKKP